MHGLFQISIPSLAAACVTSSLGAVPPLLQLIPEMDYAQSVSDDGAIVVGVNLGMNGVRWTWALGPEFIGGASAYANGSYTVCVSGDGSTIASDAHGTDGVRRASKWVSGTEWLNLPSFSDSNTLDGLSTSTWGINGDGSVVVGLGWSYVTGGALGRKWDSVNGNTAVMSLVPGTSTRLNGTSATGAVVWGWNNTAGGSRRGIRRTGSTSTWITYTNPSGTLYYCGEALGGSPSGDAIVGMNIFSSGLNSGWMWKSATNQVTPLPNLAEFAGQVPLPVDVTADGNVVVGSSGGLPIGRKAIRWVNGQPESLYAHLTALGTTGLSDFLDLGTVMAITPDGRFIVGFGAGVSDGTPDGGWIVDMDPPQPCPLDIDGDGMIAAGDLSILLSGWGGCQQAVCLGDFNFDGTVDASDLSQLLSAWGQCP